MADIKIVMSVEDDDVLKAIKNTEKLEKEVKNLEKGYKALDSAYNKGKLSLLDYSKGVNQLDTRIAKLNKVLGSGSDAINKQATALVQSKNKANKFGMVAQQVGYQVGDFFVQVQSGTSALVAFGQQGTQLAGLLPGLAGAVIGIGLAVSTMLLRSFQEASGEAKTLKEAIEDVENSFDDYTDAIDTINDLDIHNKFGQLADDMKTAADESKRFAENMMFAGLEQAASKLSTASEGFSGIFERFWDRWTDVSGDVYTGMSGTELSERKNVRDLGLENAISTEAMNGFTDGLKKAATSKDAKQSFKLIKDMYTAVLSSLSDEEQMALPPKGQEFIESLKSQLQILEKIVNVGREASRKRMANYEAEKTELREQILLLRTSIDFKKESDTYIETARLNKVAAYIREQEELVKTNELTQAQADLLIKQYEELTKLEIEEKERIERAKELTAEIKEAGRAMKQLGSFGTGIDKALTVALAQLNALKSGGEAGVSGRVAGMRQDVETKTKAALDAGGDPYDILMEQDKALKNIDLLETTLLKINALKAAQKGSSKETGQQAVEALIREAKHKRDIVSLTDEQARYEQLLFKMQEDNAKKRDPLNQKQLEQEAKKIHLTNEQTLAFERQKKAQEDLANTIGSAMETSLMSMVDGTKSVKDAFRDMALDIVKHLYKVLVIQQMINSFGGAIGGPIGNALSTYGQADGGAWQGGSQIQAYADGGVVGSPTLFPMAGGKTGLMGEAGPEAIMPLKRGANGKLGVQMEGGGGDNVVINQSFNFQANGDDSVKKIIAQAAPQIAQMTKNSMLNDRRRGGTTKAVFG